MKVLKFSLLVAGLVVTMNASGVASDAGLALLTNEYSARPAGMGGAAVSILSDPNAIWYNPAAAVGLDTFTASFGHTVFWENIRFESGCFGIGLSPRFYLHGGIRMATIDDIEQRGEVPTTQPEALFGSHDISGKLGLAYRMSDDVAVGAAIGWMFEEIESWRGSEFNVDVGVNVTPRIEGLTLGAAVTGLGGDMAITKEGTIGSREIPLPTTYRFGGSYTYRWLRGAADLVYLDDQAHAHLGVEGTVSKELNLRAGYMSGYDTRNITAGASFAYRNVRVDYAFLPYSDNLGTSHLFNVTFSL
ncbi:MAG: PorV/PorQ family protein [bacterium]